ncbi:hypothetical protein B6U81_03835 [Thermoplasmatales archaeon ex4484_30]|nr:MAG: hypothetical protein B6U81_03835 [Thermoplasmatales archaeon ex4484_30]
MEIEIRAVVKKTESIDKVRKAKEAAYVGKINFLTVKHPMGGIEVVVKADDIASIINWLTEKNSRK